MIIKQKIFFKCYRTFKKRLNWLLLALISTSLCMLIRLPVLAQVPNLQKSTETEITSNLLKNAQDLQAAGLYRRACGTLLESLRLPPPECKTLIRDEDTPKLTEILSKLSDSQLNATTLRNLGDILRIVGAIENSEDILQQSWQMSQRLKDEPNISATLVSLGNTKRALGKRQATFNNQEKAEMEYKDAFKYYQNALAITAPPITNLRAKLNLFNLLIETTIKSDIGDLPQQIQSQLAELPSTREAVYARMDFARSLTCLKLQQQPERDIQYIAPLARICSNLEAKEELQKADVFSWKDIGQLLATSIQQAKNLKDERLEAYTLGQLGELYEITEQWSSAKQITEEALRISQSIQAWDIAYRWQWQLGRLQINNEKNLESAIKDYTVAFNTLQYLRKDLTSLNPDLQFNFRDEVEPVYRELVDLLLQTTPEGKEPSQENLVTARNVIESLQLAELNNFFREACLNAVPKQIDQIDKNAAVIYPIILQNRLEVILSIAGKPLLHNAIALPITQVDDAVKQLRESLKIADTNLGKIKTQSKQLYDWLLKPFEVDLEMAESREKSNIKTLVFVLDGSLRNIPMAVLYNGQEYLVERYAIALAPGLQLLSKPLPLKQINALIGGAKNAPSFQKENFGEIDNVEIELNEISKEIPSQKLPEAKFSRTNIQNQIKSSNFSIIHLATHGKFSSNPDETFILAWDERIKVKDLDKLLRQINQPQSNPIELLVLSACQTAQGDDRAALGLAGVAIRAGARSTLATLWQVNDASTTELMILFYQELKKSKLTKAEALRQAQLALLRNYSESEEDYQKPYYWAPFIMIGNWF